MKFSPHTHAESYLTGSTLKNLVARAKEMGRTHFAYTDHGHMSSALKAYSACKSKGLKFVPGIEVYFKDSDCDIISGTPASRCKYFTLTIYAKDQAAYQGLANLVSKTGRPTIEIYEETQQLWSWQDLAEAAILNTEVVLGGVHCIVGKTYLADAPAAGNKILEKLKGLFKDNLSVSLVAEPWSKKWHSVVQINFEDGSTCSLLASDMVTTDKARKLKAIELTEKSHHSKIIATYSGQTFSQIDKPFRSAKLHKGFLPLPGGDAALSVNRFLYALAERHGVNVLVTDYAYYANKEDKIVQTMKLEGTNKLHPSLYMKNEEEVRSYFKCVMGLSEDQITQILSNNDSFAHKFDNLVLKYDWRLADPGGSAINMVLDIVRANGRMRWDDPKWLGQLKLELEVLHQNGIFDFMPYFLPIRDVLNHYIENGLLVGPGRGSAGGSLLVYLLGITQIDPFKYELPFTRFFSMARVKTKKLPDIDVDLEDRELLVGADGSSGYLYGRWGNKAAQISTRTTVRLKSAILDTNRFFMGKVEDEIKVLTSGLPTPPQGVSDAQFIFGYEDDEGEHHDGLFETSNELKAYAAKRPKEWDIVSKAMGLTRSFSQHASAFVLSDMPIKDIVPVKDGHIAQYEAKECEAAGLIKYDFLVVKQLKDIRVALDLINKKNQKYGEYQVGYFDHQGNKTYIYDLPADPEVYRSVWGGSTETCFQINSRSMTPFVMQMLPETMMDLATVLALIRPGPLDMIDEKTGRNMAEEYLERRKGASQPDIPELADILPKTYGILCYQEDLGKVAKLLAGFTDEEAELLRENMAKKKMVELTKMRPQFIEGAIKSVKPDVAEKIWDMMVTFGRYGFSIIHAVEYAHITYACMFLKHYYPLEWWAAILTNAKEKEITGEFWPYVKDMVMPPDINLSGDQMVVDYNIGKIRSKLGIIRGMGEKTIDPIVAGRPYKDIQDFVNKDVAGDSTTCKLIHVGVLDSLFDRTANIAEKLKAYRDAVEIKKFEDKKAESVKTGKKMRATEPKKGEIPEEYLNLHPIQEAAMKKAVLPSMPIDFHTLGAKYSKVIAPYNQYPLVMSHTGHETVLISGNALERLDQMEPDQINKDAYVAATCFIIEAKEFPYAGGSKRALKLIIDADGYVSEKVLWPDYDTGILNYPPATKKGAVATIFFRKKAGGTRKDLNVRQIVIEG